MALALSPLSKSAYHGSKTQKTPSRILVLHHGEGADRPTIRGGFWGRDSEMALKILSVVGARPNFMKIAAICEAVKDFNRCSSVERIDNVLVHTGQHYDAPMSDFFFNDLELPRPDLFLGVGSASHSQQTAWIMERFESVLLQERPDVVLVV